MGLYDDYHDDPVRRLERLLGCFRRQRQHTPRPEDLDAADELIQRAVQDFQSQEDR